LKQVKQKITRTFNSGRAPAFALAVLLSIAFSARAETLNRGLGPEPDSLDIHQAQGLAAINLLRDLREGLITFDVNGEPAPGVAASWRVLDGGRRYRFTLREDARWSDAERVTAQDFVRAWRRAFSPGRPAATAGLLGGVENASGILAGEKSVESLGIRAVSADELEVVLTEPAPWIIEILAHPVSFPLHPDALDDPRSAPVNGSYTLEEWTPRAAVKLRRNRNFHSIGAVALESVAYYPIEEPAAELSRFRAGELHITETIPAGRYEWLKENLADELRVHAYLGSFWLGINMRNAALGYSAPLRLALALAIDRETLARVVLGAGELPAWSVVPPGIEGYEPVLLEAAAWTQERREAEAVRLFRASGFGTNEPLRLELRYNTSGVHRRMAVAVAAMWKQVLGVATQLVNEEWKVFVNNRQMGVVTEVFRGGWIADYADPATFLELFVGGSNLNHTFYDNPTFDQLMHAARLAEGRARMNLLREGERMLLQDMPVIPLYYYVSRHLVDTKVTGFVDNVRDIHLSRYLGLEPERP
jgi:oligopeptide transport system substrate-binding protein